MRTKTLLAAAVLAAGLASSKADVFSQNIVGYVNKTIPSGFAIIANPFTTGVSNGVNEIFPNLPDGLVVYLWNNGTVRYTASVYFGGSWFDNDTFAPVGPPILAPGTGAFVNNPSSPTNVTYVGQVTPGPNQTNTIPLPSGYALVGSDLPLTVPVDNTNLNLTLTDGIVLYQWNNPAGKFAASVFFGGTWFDNDTFAVVNTPTNTMGEGFFYLNSLAATNWIQKLIQ